MSHTPRKNEKKKTTHISLRQCIGPRECHRHLDIPARKTKLIPALQHPAPIPQPVIRRALHQYAQLPSPGRDLLRVVPLHVVRRPVPDVDRFPVRVVPRVERAVVHLELVREHELVLLAVEAGAGRSGAGRGFVDELGHLEPVKQTCQILPHAERRDIYHEELTVPAPGQWR